MLEVSAGLLEGSGRRMRHVKVKPGAGLDFAAAKPALPPAARFETEAGITAADIHKRVDYLASPELAGRMTGSPGEKLADDYAAEVQGITLNAV